jgi:hypothetical protein
MKEKGRHSYESGNPGNLKKNNLLEITRYFSMAAPAWMPASAGMTNYDTVSGGRGQRKGGKEGEGNFVFFYEVANHSFLNP